MTTSWQTEDLCAQQLARDVDTVRTSVMLSTMHTNERYYRQSRQRHVQTVYIKHIHNYMEIWDLAVRIMCIFLAGLALGVFLIALIEVTCKLRRIKHRYRSMYRQCLYKQAQIVPVDVVATVTTKPTNVYAVDVRTEPVTLYH